MTNAATTGGAAQVVIVNGPVAQQLGINGDAACFGPGFRANAVIGRALRLVIRNLAGLVPGEMDKATHATPGRYSFCFSENEERSPWEPRHRELGYPSSASTVTVVAIRSVHPVMETTVATGTEVMRTVVGTMKAVGVSSYYQLGTGAQIVLVLCPEHAADIASANPIQGDLLAGCQVARIDPEPAGGGTHEIFHGGFPVEPGLSPGEADEQDENDAAHEMGDPTGWPRC